MLQNAPNTLLVPTSRIRRLSHCPLLRRRRSALSALRPSWYAVMTKTESGTGVGHVDDAEILPRPGPTQGDPRSFPCRSILHGPSKRLFDFVLPHACR